MEIENDYILKNETFKQISIPFGYTPNKQKKHQNQKNTNSNKNSANKVKNYENEYTERNKTKNIKKKMQVKYNIIYRETDLYQ